VPPPADEQRDDYDDGQHGRRPELSRRAESSGKPKPGPLRLGLQVGLTFGLVGLCMVGMIGVTERSKEAHLRNDSKDCLRQIGVAVQNYHESFGELPKNTYTADGKPLLSWRVHLLPFIEHDHLYTRFKLDEPWDGPNNIKLLTIKVPTYTVSGSLGAYSGLTYYRGFSSLGAVFERRPGDHRLTTDGSYPPFGFESFADGTSNTILVVEAADPVEWTKPDDLDATPGKPFPKMGGLGWRKGFQALLADGTVRLLRPDTPEATLRSLVTHSGGEAVPPDWDKYP
jgi:hypothetical protein